MCQHKFLRVALIIIVSNNSIKLGTFKINIVG